MSIERRAIVGAQFLNRIIPDSMTTIGDRASDFSWVRHLPIIGEFYSSKLDNRH
jgi:hypothetical protein